MTNQLIQPRCWDFFKNEMSLVTMILFPSEEIDWDNNINEPKMAYHFDIMYPIDVLDVNKRMIYVGDIVSWWNESYTVDGVPDNVRTQANNSYQQWSKSDREEPYDFEANGWKPKLNYGVIVKYHGQNCIHTEYNTINHEINCFYNGTTYYGPVQHKKDYTIIGNIHENPKLLNNKYE